MALFKKKLTKSDKDLKQKKVSSDVGVGKASDQKELVVKKSKVATKMVSKKEKTKPVSVAYKYLVKPLITEKVSLMGHLNKYAFEVSDRANKSEVKKAIEQLYSVKVVGVNMLNLTGKKVRYGRNQGNRKNWKKAIVTLKAGDKIEIYEGV